MILKTSVGSVKKAAIKIATKNRRPMNPKAKHKARASIVASQANTIRIVTLLKVIEAMYQVANCRDRNWFIAIPKTEQKVVNMQIMDAPVFINWAVQ